MKSLSSDLQDVDQRCDVIELCGKLNITTAACKEFVRYSLANALLMERKQHDYGPENIADFGAFGCLVRINDKMKRLKHLFLNRKKRAVNESITDSFRDIPNYAIIALMCEDAKWPRV